MLICLNYQDYQLCGTENRDGARHCRQCGKVLRFILNFLNPGSFVDARYRIVRLIGWGSFGAVYEAESVENPDLHVALKEIFDLDAFKNLQQDFALLQTLQHPNLPVFHELFTSEGNGYLVMDFCAGPSLAEVLKEEVAINEAQALEYIRPICDLLSYLQHQNLPLVHRDLKPANIRLTPEGQIKLVDFGLCKVMQVGMLHRSARLQISSYLPPEQLRGGADQRGDIYSLGATLYHLLTRFEPLNAIDRLLLSPDPLIALCHYNPLTSPHVSAAVIKAMQMKPEDRFADAEALKRALFNPPSA